MRDILVADETRQTFNFEVVVVERAGDLLTEVSGGRVPEVLGLRIGQDVRSVGIENGLEGGGSGA